MTNARPILFSAPMIRALLDGRKTQTRRLFKERVSTDCIGFVRVGNRAWAHKWRSFPEASNHPCEGLKAWSHHCPYGDAGDLLWVRESGTEILAVHGVNHELLASRGFQYSADGTIIPEAACGKGKARPSIHMPRWASRLTLKLTDIRVERLQDISEEDAKAEGGIISKVTGKAYENMAAMRLGGPFWMNAKDWYADLWESINGPGSWAANPWVWVLAFNVHHGNAADNPTLRRVVLPDGQVSH